MRISDWSSDVCSSDLIFLVFLLAVSFALVGVAGHYGARPPLAAMAVIWVLTILAVPAIFSMTYGSTLRLMLYQLPYFAMQVLIGLVIWRSGRRQPLALLLIALQAVAAIIYAVKPFLPPQLGTGSSPQGYMRSEEHTSE